MRRREFILISSAAVCWPLAARAQQPVGMPRIGVLMGIGDGDPEAKPRVEALQTGLRELGWRKVTIFTLIIAGRPAIPDLAQQFAKEIVALKPKVIVVHSTPAVKADQA
jgi:putative tryptophan/tyrosine transport system substrate-binding protein